MKGFINVIAIQNGEFRKEDKEENNFKLKCFEISLNFNEANHDYDLINIFVQFKRFYYTVLIYNLQIS